MNTALHLFLSDLALIGLGVVMLISPQLMYKLTEGWKYGDARKPPRPVMKVYLWATRFGGVMFILVGIGSLIVPFLS